MSRLSKLYKWDYLGLIVETELVKNDIWRWYSSAYKTFSDGKLPERVFVHSSGSKAITKWGAIRDMKKTIDASNYGRISPEQRLKYGTPEELVRPKANMPQKLPKSF